MEDDLVLGSMEENFNGVKIISGPDDDHQPGIIKGKMAIYCPKGSGTLPQQLLMKPKCSQNIAKM